MTFKKGETQSEEMQLKAHLWQKDKAKLKEVGEKISEAKKGRISPFKGKHHTPEAIEKNRLAHLGKVSSRKGKTLKPLSENHRKNISKGINKFNQEHPELRTELGQRMSGENHPMFGRHHTEEAKKIIKQKRAKQKEKYDSVLESILRIALISLKIPFRKHKDIYLSNGSHHQVDIFIEPNICIEADGDYFHNTEEQKTKDIFINKDLKEKGYVVFRIWGHEITEGRKIGNLQRLKILDIEKKLIESLKKKPKKKVILI